MLAVLAFRAAPLTSFLPSAAGAGNKKKTGRARACSAGFAIRSTRRVGDQQGALRRASLHLRPVSSIGTGSRASRPAKLAQFKHLSQLHWAPELSGDPRYAFGVSPV